MNMCSQQPCKPHGIQTKQNKNQNMRYASMAHNYKCIAHKTKQLQTIAVCKNKIVKIQKHMQINSWTYFAFSFSPPFVLFLFDCIFLVFFLIFSIKRSIHKLPERRQCCLSCHSCALPQPPANRSSPPRSPSFLTPGQLSTSQAHSHDPHTLLQTSS